MHSYIIVGNKQEEIETVLTGLIPFKDFQSSPDFLILEAEGSVGIEVIRDLKKFLSRKPYQETTKVVFIPTADRLTLPAQQAILKTLEEPPGECLIVLSTANDSLLSPTILSRCQVIRLGNDVSPVASNTADLIGTIRTLGVGDRVMLASKYAFPKHKADRLCLDFINYFRHELMSSNNAMRVVDLKLAKKAYERIKANTDSKLTLEYLFLNLR